MAKLWQLDVELIKSVYLTWEDVKDMKQSAALNLQFLVSSVLASLYIHSAPTPIIPTQDPCKGAPCSAPRKGRLTHLKPYA